MSGRGVQPHVAGGGSGSGPGMVMVLALRMAWGVQGVPDLGVEGSWGEQGGGAEAHLVGLLSAALALLPQGPLAVRGQWWPPWGSSLTPCSLVLLAAGQVVCCLRLLHLGGQGGEGLLSGEGTLGSQPQNTPPQPLWS